MVSRYSDMPTAAGNSTAHKRSGTVARLREAGSLVHAPLAFATMPNTLKQTYAALCGVMPEPRHWDQHVQEFEPQSALLEGCLPRVLQRRRLLAEEGVRREGRGAAVSDGGGLYRSAFLTSSSVVAGVHSSLGFDRVEGFAGNGAGLQATFQSGSAAEGTFEDFGHGGYERTNWLGLDDDVLLPPAHAAIRRAHLSGHSAFLTLFTVGTHSGYALPSHIGCSPDASHVFVHHALNRTRGARHDNESAWKRPRHDRRKIGRYRAPAARTSAEAARRYRCAVAYADSWLLKLARGLDRKEREEAGGRRGGGRRLRLSNTLLVVVGDHGEAFGEHAGEQQHGTALYNEALHVPMWLAGGPVRRARAAGLLRTSEDGGLPSIHRLEDLSATIRDLVGCSWRALASAADARAEAAQALLYARLGRLGLGGRSMLATSPPREAPRSHLLMGMFGTRKVGLLRRTGGGLTEKATFSWEGCGRKCRLLESTLHRLDTDAEERAPAGFAGHSGGGGAGAASSDGERSAGGASLAEWLQWSMGLLASLSSLHLSMRTDASGGRGRADNGSTHGSSSTSLEARDALLRANERLRAWLAQVAPSEDGTLRVRLETKASCACDPGFVDLGSCNAAHRTSRPPAALVLVERGPEQRSRHDQTRALS